MSTSSSSLSEFPSTKKIQIKELISNGKQIVFKHFSKEEIHTGNKVQITGIAQEISVSHDKQPRCKSWSVKFERPLRIKSMKAESKNNKPRKFKTYTSSENKIRPLCITESSENKQTGNKRCYVILPALIAFLAIFVSSALYMASFRRTCEMPLNVLELKYSLLRSVYGQEEAINEIESELNTFSHTDGPEMKILAFLGGVGVGKSYTASLLALNFPWDSNVQEFVLPVQASSLIAEDVCYGFSTCGYNLVVVDGLTPNDATEVASFLKDLRKCSDSRVIVVLVFGIKDHEDKLYVAEEYVRRSLEEARVIAFQPLQQEHVEMCVQETFFKHGVPWRRAMVQKVLSLLPLNTGCKGLSSKVQMVIQEEFA